MGLMCIGFQCITLRLYLQTRWIALLHTNVYYIETIQIISIKVSISNAYMLEADLSLYTYVYVESIILEEAHAFLLSS